MFEEGLFRGYIMQVALKKAPKLLGIVVQALVFGLMHYYNYSIQLHIWIKITDAMLIGLIFGIIVIKTKSLMFVIGAHLFYNVTEQMLFVDNSYKFTRLISFQNSNSSSSSLLGSIAYTEFIELIMLSIYSNIINIFISKRYFI